jgi:diadenosine tetraphosphate (Ap4A) HIT family hydrolase
MNACEFCAEFQADEPARFRSMYNGLASHRIVARTERFVAVPTLGQLFEGSVLVLPITHVETCAALDNDEREEMLGLIESMISRARSNGNPVVFEHGATSANGGGCGIYHAHLHVVPLPEKTSADLLFPEASEVCANLRQAWRALQGSTHYLLLGDADCVRSRDLDERPGVFASQFFRRRIAERFSLSQPWDWRSYTQVEPALLRMLADSVADAT